MSVTTVKALWPGQKAEDWLELRNVWGYGLVVWGALGERYLGRDLASLLLPTESKRLWALGQDPRVPPAQRAVLVMTFDYAYVARENYRRAAEDIRSLLREFPPAPTGANHWPEIAALFDTDPDVPALGFWMTSVSDDPFDPPEWDRCFEVYAYLEAIAE